MKRLALASGAGLLAGAIACGVISIPAEPIAPVNACGDNASCALTFADAAAVPQCSVMGACIGGSAFHPILVVTVPEDPHSAVLGSGGMTLALPDDYQATRASLAPLCTAPVSTPECDFVPPLATIDQAGSGSGGSLRVSDSFGKKVWPPGLRPNQPPPPLPNTPPPTSLPIHAVFRPLWTDPATGTAILAKKLGLPLDDRAATVSLRFSTFAGPLLAPTVSSKQQPGFAFGVKIPQPISPTDPSGAYELLVTPDSPFDVVPPYVAPYTLPLAAAGTQGLGLDISSFVTIYDQSTVLEGDYTVQELAGAPSLDGWKLHIDRDDGTRVSSLVTLGAGATKDVQVYWTTGTDQSSQTLYIDPPPGVDLPRYFSPPVGPTFFGPFAYPAIPSPVIASGFIRRATDNALTTAQVFFVANGDPQAYVVEQDGTTPAPLLYEKQAVTTGNGQFSLTLPPGLLRAYVVPDDPSLALTQASLTLDPFEGRQSGKTFFVNPRSHVTGRVLLPDGTPVFAADVVVDPSADAPFSTTEDPHLRPRESRGTTDTDGRFDVLSDPGDVDVSIRPHDGTQLPWVVLVSRKVLPTLSGDAGVGDGLALGDVVVNLPTPFTQSGAPGVLVDTAGKQLPFTLVRAYAFPAPVAVDGGAPQPRGARLIGSTVTDANGVFQLYVLPPE